MSINDKNLEEFRDELERMIDLFGMEGDSNVPSSILADYLAGCLLNFGKAAKVNARHRENIEEITRTRYDRLARFFNKHPGLAPVIICGVVFVLFLALIAILLE